MPPEEQSLHYVTSRDGFSASLSGILGLENLIELFQSATLRLDEEEVYEPKFKYVPKYEKHVAGICQCYEWSGPYIGTYNQYLIFWRAMGAAKVFTNEAHPAVN